VLDLSDRVDVVGERRRLQLGHLDPELLGASPKAGGAARAVERLEQAGLREGERVGGPIRGRCDRDPVLRHRAQEREQVARLHVGEIGVDDERRPLGHRSESGPDGSTLTVLRIVDDGDAVLGRQRAGAVGIGLGDEDRRADGRRGGDHVREHPVGDLDTGLLVERLEAALRGRGAERDDDAGHGGETTQVGSAREPDNAEYAAKLEAFATLLELAGANTYSVRAYRRAAELIRESPVPVAELVRSGRIRELRGVGPSIEARLRELVETGELHELRELEERISPDLVGVGRMLGLSAKRSVEIGEALGVRTLDELRDAAEAGRLREVPGIGPKTEATIRAALAQELEVGRPTKALLLNRALALIADVAVALDGERAGDPRRFRDRCEQLAVVVAAAEPTGTIARFEAVPQIVALVEREERRAVGVTVEGVAVELLVPTPKAAGTALVRATGSAEYVAALEPLRDAASELEVYERLGIPWCPPELREQPFRGEPPPLVELADLRGDLHCHTTWSDGRGTVEEMGRAAQELGYEYLAICDHTVSVTVVPGLTADDVRRQGEEIAAANEVLAPFRILRGIECDIRADGTLDLPDYVLAELDWVMASIHAGQRGSKEQLTERTLAAVYNPHVSAISHPTGRLIDRRPPNAVDLERLFAACVETGTALETNGLPDRLDLKDEHIRLALEAGVAIVASTDAHSTRGLGNIVLAVGTARRGWATAADVVNTRPLDEVLATKKPGAVPRY
jgi:DNA polymerase (family X)